MSAPSPLAGVSPRDTTAYTPPMPAPAPSTAHTTLHQLQQLLPTCQRCRRLRRKCDTQLPNCQPCHRAGVECTIFDHALKQTLPRAYVQSLLTRVEHLEAVKASGGRALTDIHSAGRGAAETTSTTTTTTATTPSSATTLAQPHLSPVAGIDDSMPGHDHPPSPSHSPSHSPSNSPSYDVVVPSAASAGKSRYWGASSVFALTVEILQHATARGYVSLEDVGGGATPSFPPVPDVDLEEQRAAPSHYHHYNANALAGEPSAALELDIRALISLYLVSSNTLYGFVDPDQAQADLQVYLAVRRQQRQANANGGGNSTTPNSAFGSMTTPPSGGVTSPGLGMGSSGPAALGDQAHSYFRIAMMCAIACATKARYRPQRTAESLAYYADAVTYVEEVTAEVSPASLQALLLLILFCLFFPRKGDVWKLLDYACRLALELGYHTETDMGASDKPSTAVPGVEPTPPPGGETEAQKKLRRSTFWGLYAIERIVGQLFGRGSDLPESIITAAYPSALVSLVPAVGASTGAAATATPPPALSLPDVDGAELQSISIAHHYRLVYLRSEIFRTLYLPAKPHVDGSPPNPPNGLPEPQLDWLRQQYQTLSAWRQELAVPSGDQREGVATLTCDVGYDATMCFLFQPLLLRALRETADVGTGDGSGEGEPVSPTVASDPFYSSIHLIRTYEKIIRAPEASALGSYPMTFMSAHYIYLASSTLLAHALLRLDERVTLLPRMGGQESLAELDWGAYVDVSSSCLILLAWCGERWPGMLGMLGVYQRLFRRTIRELIGKGIVR